MAATAHDDGHDTGQLMPRSAPPRSTRAGHLHAAAAIPALPVQPSFDAPSPPTVSDGPLAGLTVPEAAAEVPKHALRRLDRGRLSVPHLIEAAGWADATMLRADVTRRGAVTLYEHNRGAGPVAGSSRVHTDTNGRIVLTEGIRAHLGIAADASVFACVNGDRIEVTTVARVLAGLDALTDLEAAKSASNLPQPTPLNN